MTSFNIFEKIIKRKSNFAKKMMMNRAEFQKIFFQTLITLYPQEEVRAQFHLYIEEKLKTQPYQWYLDLEKNIEEDYSFFSDLRRLQSGEPIQYLLGYADFYDLRLKVTPAVLIPRPETEELVHFILHEFKNDLNSTSPINILDLGTGSGAIAIALAKHLPNANVVAIDNCAEVLSVARENANHYQLSIQFEKWDMLRDALKKNWYFHFDLIVSNPPYIPESNKKKLHINVTNYEPADALFVPDKFPLIFYQKIAQIGTKCLKRGGKTALETYHLYHEELKTIFYSFDYMDIRIKKDIQNQPRIFFCKKRE